MHRQTARQQQSLRFLPEQKLPLSLTWRCACADYSISFCSVAVAAHSDPPRRWKANMPYRQPNLQNWKTLSTAKTTKNWLNAQRISDLSMPTAQQVTLTNYSRQDRHKILMWKPTGSINCATGWAEYSEAEIDRLLYFKKKDCWHFLWQQFFCL